MKLPLFSIYDVKVEAYSAPICCRNYADAERWFSDVLNDPQSQYAKHKEDYQLFHVGHFDQDTGLVEGRQEVTRIHGLEVSHG